MDLPAELRVEVYKHVVPSGKLFFARPLSYKSAPLQLPAHLMRYTDLLFVNQEISTEVQGSLHLTMTENYHWLS